MKLGTTTCHVVIATRHLQTQAVIARISTTLCPALIRLDHPKLGEFKDGCVEVLENSDLFPFLGLLDNDLY
jgi:hypothetical protein